MKNTNKTKYLILGLLSEQPLSGYEIKRLVDTRFSFFWSESFGQIYPQLARLEAEETIKTSNEALNDNSSKRNSKKYFITEKGINKLQKWLKEPVEKEVVRYEILLKMYFSNHVSSEIMLQHIREFQINHKKQQRLFERFEEDIRSNVDVHENHKQVLMVLSFGQKVWNTYDQWCSEIISVLEKK